MCTALTLSTKDGKHLFGRSLDVTHSYNQKVQVIPRHFPWVNVATQQTHFAKYASIGMGVIIDNHPYLFDGMNEGGLAGAGLLFTSFAKFSPRIVPGKFCISSSDFLYWALSENSSLKELREALNTVILTSIPINPETPVSKLHWIFTDKTGESLVVESTEDGLHLYNNPVGVLTNDPPFDWQLTNLSQYVTINCNTPSPRQMGELLVRPFGNGLGMCGLPGDGSSASRFIRTVFFKDAATEATNEKNGVTTFFNILSEVNVIKGSEVTADGFLNFTAYQSTMCQESLTYYYIDYENRRINAVKLTPQNMNSNYISTFPYLNTQDILYLN